MKKTRKLTTSVGVLAAVAVAATGLIATGISSAAPSATMTVALISDVGRFNDKSFNQSQLEGLMRAKKDFGIKAIPLQSNSDADYLPNLTTAVRRNSNLIICAGFLMANDCAKVARKFKKTEFAITDYGVNVPPFKGDANVTGLTYAANEGGCLVGHMAALMAKKQGGKQVVGAVGGIKIPPVDDWIIGFSHCAKKANKAVKVLIGYSQDFVDQTKCKTVAENQIAQGAQVLFQVAGLCGLGTLKAADEAKIWGIGVDKDQYNDAKRVLTSGVKRVDQGVYLTAKALVNGSPLGGGDLKFDLANGGMDLGKTNPAVSKAIKASTLKLKADIISGKVKVPGA